MAHEIVRIAPKAAAIARQNRAFLGRVVWYLASRGIRQFLDIGSGLPTQDNVHEVAARLRPDARVVYVDNDPVVLAHTRALLDSQTDVVAIQGDLRDPFGILEHPEVRMVLNFREPVAILLLSVLHFVEDESGPFEIVQEINNVTPPGSYLALSHGTIDDDPDGVAMVESVFQATGCPLAIRSPDVVARFFDGLDLVSPGLVRPMCWRPDRMHAPGDDLGGFFGGLGRKSLDLTKQRRPTRC